jgi:hypothetical protein
MCAVHMSTPLGGSMLLPCTHHSGVWRCSMPEVPVLLLACQHKHRWAVPAGSWQQQSPLGPVAPVCGSINVFTRSVSSCVSHASAAVECSTAYPAKASGCVSTLLRPGALVYCHRSYWMPEGRDPRCVKRAAIRIETCDAVRKTSRQQRFLQ